MIKLIESELFGHNLVKVNTPSLVKRYNDCLSDIGLANTKLKSFHVDGWGWSPEIAQEQGDRFYLSHGLANPYGIIISPKQAHSPLYMPYHSFDRNIHAAIHSEYAEQIADITSRSGLWFELDQEISAYRSPQDLLLLDYVKVNFVTVDRIMAAAKEQKELVREFYDKPQAWSNDGLRQKIIESCKTHGDLRFMKFDIPSHPYNDINTFYTLAFEGVYVFRKLKNDKPLLVYETKGSDLSGETKHTHVEFQMGDSRLVTFLYNAGLISNDLEIYRANPSLVEVMQEFILLQALSQSSNKVAYHELNKNQKKGIINTLIKEQLLPDAYFDFEHLTRGLKDGSIKDSSDIPNSLREYLLNPSHHLSSQEKSVIWQLLSNFNTINPVLTYLFDKSKFYTQFQTFEEDAQLWIIDQVLAHKNIYNDII